MPPEDHAVHARRNVVAGAATLVAIALVAAFAWRVAHYATLIRSGELTEADLAFVDRVSSPGGSPLSADASLEAIPGLATADDPSLGARDAVLTVVEFADFGCPFSREESVVVRSLAAALGDRVRFVYRDFPIDELHPEARAASEAAECAAEQGMFWEYHDKLYANQSDHSAAALRRYAVELNLDAGDFARCLESDRNVREIAEDVAAGTKAGVYGTPTFFLNGTRVPGAIPEDVFEKLIDRFAPARVSAL